MLRALGNIKWRIYIIVFILFISLFVFHQYILSGYYFLSKGLLSDLLRANLPTYYQLFDALKDDRSLWSWKMGIGTSMFTHADVYFDPFTYILFVFGKTKIPQMMIWSFISKIVVEGLCISCYLNYFKLDKRATIIASVLYAFSGYSLIMGSNLALGTIMVYAPLLLLGIERWLDSGKHRLFIIILFLTCIYSYYFFYAIGILLVFYVIVGCKNRGNFSIPKLFSLLKMAILVIAMSAFSILPQLSLTLASSRVSGNTDVGMGMKLFAPEISVLLTSLTRVMSNDILGSVLTSKYVGANYFFSHDYFQLSTYTSGVFFVLLVHYFFYSNKVVRRKICIISVLIFTTILFPVFSFVLNGFSTINARWMFFFTLIECVTIAFSIDSIIKNGGLKILYILEGYLLSISIIFFACFILATHENSMLEVFKSYLCSTKKYLLVISALTFLLMLTKFIQNTRIVILKKFSLTMLVIFIIFADINANYYHWYGNENSVSEYSEKNKSDYFDSSSKLISDLRKHDTAFYRIDKNFDSVYDNNDIPSENDSMAQNYYGLKSYNSVNNKEYITFLQEIGIYVACPVSVPQFIQNNISPKEVTGSQLNYIDGVGTNYNLLSYFGVKYYLINDNTKLSDNFIYLNSLNKVKVYKNENAYPLAFVNDKIMSKSELDKLSLKEKQIALLEYTIVDGDNASYSSLNKSESYISKLANDKNEAITDIKFTQDEVSFKINVSKDNQYLSLAMPYDSDWKIYIDGKKVNTVKINISLLGTKINSGEHFVKLVYEPQAIYCGGLISIGSIAIFLILIIKSKNKLKLSEDKIRILESRIFENIQKLNGKYKIAEKCKMMMICFSLIIVSTVVVLVSILVFKQQTFLKKDNLKVITDWSQVKVNDYEINNNNFVTMGNDPNLIIPSTGDSYNTVEVNFDSIANIANSDSDLQVQLYYAPIEGNFNSKNVIVNRVNTSNLSTKFTISSKKPLKFRIDIGTETNDQFSLNNIRFYKSKTEVTTHEILIVTMSIIILTLLLFMLYMNKSKTNTIARNSNLELARVICMLIIIAHHCSVHGGSYNMAGMSANHIFALFLIPGGKLAFDCFIALSCWFLVEQKFKMQRFLKVWIMVFTYSLTFTIITFLLGGITTPINWFSVFLPIIGNSHGFAASYLAFYLLIPFLNILSTRINKFQARFLMIILLYFEVVSKFVGVIDSYMQPLSSELLLFVLMYIIALNLKKWPVKIVENKAFMLFMFSMIWIALWMGRYLYAVSPESHIVQIFLGTMYDESSITNIVGGYCLFFFFLYLKERKMPFVNYLATGAFGILLIHDHNFFRYELWLNLLKAHEWYESKYFVIIILAIVIWIYTLGFFIDRIRYYLIEKSIFKIKIINKICEKVDKLLEL